MWLLDVISKEEYKLLLDKYCEEYVLSLDKDNFYIVYNMFFKNNFYYVNDIILRYLEVFFMKPEDVLEIILLLKITYGNNFVYLIGENLNILGMFLNEC